MNYSKKNIIYIDSNLREIQSTSHTDLIYKIELAEYDYTHVVLLDLTIPKSFYSVSSSNNSFTVEENSIQRVITLDVGNYSRKSLRNVLVNLLNVDPSYVYNITFANSSSQGDDGKYNFSCVTTDPQPKFIFENGLSDVMGFEKNTTYDFVAGTLKSVNVIDLRYKKQLFLLSSICHNPTGRGDNILNNISSTFTDYEYLTWVNRIPMEYSKVFSKDSTNLFTFRIVDENGVTIDLNGLSWNCSIMLYKQSTLATLIKQYILMKSKLLLEE